MSAPSVPAQRVRVIDPIGAEDFARWCTRCSQCAICLRRSAARGAPGSITLCLRQTPRPICRPHGQGIQGAAAPDRSAAIRNYLVRALSGG